MSGKYPLGFELYLICGVIFLVACLRYQRLRQTMFRLGRAGHPSWNEKHFVLLNVFLLIIFSVVTAVNTIYLLAGKGR